MGRIKPVVRCKNCPTPCCEYTRNREPMATCPEAQPREIGTCGECFWIGDIVEGKKLAFISNIYHCRGDASCSTYKIELNINGVGMTGRAAIYNEQGGPYWWPAEEKKHVPKSK